jgi:4-diphosphocytidyl-2-C-methyl-D-erythritol kinase
MPPNFEIAYAKINLTLHVRRRRDDGYHELESLVAFLNYGDEIEIQSAPSDSLTVEGEFSRSVGNEPDNLVIRALQWAREADNPDIPPLAIRLVKHLPVAAGLGGGSADAAALLRLLAHQGLFSGLNDLRAETAVLGADVPACIVSKPLIMRGIGEQIAWVADQSLAPLSAVLVNPGVPLSAGPVFKAWDQIDRGGLHSGDALGIALSGRNDLQPPAIALCPIIGDVLVMLEATGPIVARMSGSGATCFALYDDAEKASAAAASIMGQKPAWWIRAGRLTS